MVFTSKTILQKLVDRETQSQRKIFLQSPFSTMKSNVVGEKITSDVKIDKTGRMKETAYCSFNSSRVERCIPPVGRAVTGSLNYSQLKALYWSLSP